MNEMFKKMFKKIIKYILLAIGLGSIGFIASNCFSLSHKIHLSMNRVLKTGPAFTINNSTIGRTFSSKALHSNKSDQQSKLHTEIKTKIALHGNKSDQQSKLHTEIKTKIALHGTKSDQQSKLHTEIKTKKAKHGNKSDQQSKLHTEIKTKIKTGEVTLSNCTKGLNQVGPLYIDQGLSKSMDVIEKEMSVLYGGTVEKGGWWTPNKCKPATKVAIIIPYRNRPEQLQIFLHHMHPILQRQQLFYRIIAVEHLSDDPFNRAGMFNIGFEEALKISPFDCFVFSDVDLLPEDDRNYYGCPTSPRHMSVAVNIFDYKLPYATIFGGVGAFKKEHFQSINGMSNVFWGWGGEDDDLHQRIYAKGLKLTRPSLKLGRYTMIKKHHFQSSKVNPQRFHLLKSSKRRMNNDGLNSLIYHLKEVVEKPLVTMIKIEMKRLDYSQP